MKLTLLALALLACVSVTLSSTPAANVNRRAKARRPSTPTAAPTPNAPNNNASFIGGSTDGVGIRRRGNQNGAGVRPHDPVNANANLNANTSFIGGSDDGVGIRRKAPRKRRRP